MSDSHPKSGLEEEYVSLIQMMGPSDLGYYLGLTEGVGEMHIGPIPAVLCGSLSQFLRRVKRVVLETKYLR